MENKNVTRTELLNFLIKKHGLNRYLEIGVQVPEINFLKIECQYKTGVDPALRTIDELHGENRIKIFGKTSDEFFHNLDFFENDLGIRHFGGYDLIFIDGLHTAEQVKKDFENALKVLSPNGFIVLHDCNPLKEEHTIVPRPSERGHWNGDVYKFACELGMRSEKFTTVDIDNGCGVWDNSKEDSIPCSAYPFHPFILFDKFRKELLNLISWNEFIDSHTHV